jgi:hypothetical protein
VKVTQAQWLGHRYGIGGEFEIELNEFKEHNIANVVWI